MLRSALCIAALVACSSPPAAPRQSPGRPPPLVAPQPQAVEAQPWFLAWLDAFNAGNEAKLGAFAQQMSPELAAKFPSPADLMGFRDATGGFDVKKAEEVTPTKFVAIVKERGSDQFARVALELDDTRHVRAFDIDLVPTPAEHKPARLSEADAITALRAELDALIAKDQFSGAILVAKDGKPIFAQAYGFADRDKQVPNTLDTRFRIGSMNKMFTATATLQLVQAKKLALDDTVGELLSDYPNKNVAAKVTIHHLLTHTGGTGDIFGPDFDAKRLELRTLGDYVKLYGNRDLVHEPGAQDQYSNYGYLLLGVIVEKVSKKTYYDQVQASIFKPAKMTSTSSPFEDKPLAGRSIAYTKLIGDKRAEVWTDAKDTLPIRATSAGGGDSTVGDLLKFANALTAHKLLDKTHTELLTSRKTGEPAGGYAYGFGTTEEDGVRCFGHNGGARGMNGELYICDSGYTVAILANLDPPAASRVLRFLKARLPLQ